MYHLTALITGGGGFIGSHLAEALVASGHDVRVFDDFSTGRAANLASLPHGVRVIHGDIRDLDALRAAAGGVDVLFHQAAVASVPRCQDDPDGTLAINVTGTQHALEAARLAGVRRVVLASSAAVYGATATMPLAERMPPAPISHYGTHKLMGEYLCAVYAHLYGLETVALRYFNVYGPRQDPSSPYSGVISRFAAALRSGERVVIYGDGEQTRDFIHVTDVARANLLAATEAGAVGGVFNIGSGERISLNTLLAVMGEALGVGASADAAEYAPARAGDIRESVADITSAREALGFVPQVSLRESLSDLLRAGDAATTPGDAGRAQRETRV